MIEICVTGIKIDGKKHQLTSAIMMSMLLHAENLCQKESNNVLNNLTCTLLYSFLIYYVVIRMLLQFKFRLYDIKYLTLCKWFG